MNRFLHILFLVALSLILMVPTMSPVHAQNCIGLTVLNESTTQLNESAICEVATPFVNHGHQVYVFVTDAKVSTEEEWMAIRDRVEIGWRVYNRSTDTLSKTMVSIELTTDTTNSWGQDLAFGKQLYGTALDTDQAVKAIEGKMKNIVANGDVNGAIVNAFSEAYTKAYPPPTPTPLPTVAPVVVAGPTTNVNVDFRPLLRAIMWLLLVAVGGAIVYLFLIPLYENWRKRQRLTAYAATLRARINKLLNASVQLLEGDSPEQFPLYSLWKANGGDQYSEKDAQIRQYLSWAAKALDTAYVILHDLPENPPFSLEKLKKYIRNLETIYLTFVGNSDQILSMTENEQADLLNPFLVIPQEGVSAQLVQQVKDILRQQQGSGSLRIDLQMVDPKEIDGKGILGYIDQFKNEIHELTMAKTEAPGELKKAREARQ